jgi:hypothetical protein
MARVGGRNAFFAWVVGIGCLATLGVLAYLAVPMIPASVAWLGNTAQGTTATSDAVAAGDDQSAAGPPGECADLYNEALWAAMRFTRGAVMSPSMDAPVTSATALVTALQPQVTMTCTWHADAGTVSTTLATVPSDAGAIAAAALPGAGFDCATQNSRTTCSRTDGDLTETIAAGDGWWLSTSEDAWHPAGYATDTAANVWG